MAIRVAINGLGRIGRCILRAYAQGYKNDTIDIVAVNGPADPKQHAHLLTYDSVHGMFQGDIKVTNNSITMNDKRFALYGERAPENLPWKELDIDVVLECTGVFRNKADASKHIQAGAKSVLISAPSKDPDATIVYGVNNEALKPTDTVISVGSCTTNCLAPVVKVLNETFGIETGFMTTIHAYTNDQRILDGSHKDLRRARTAGMSMIPTSTGAAKALGEVLPEIKGKLNGVAVRVPTPNVSMVDLTFNSTKPVSVESINKAMQIASGDTLKNVLGYCDQELVSVDFNGSPFSSVFDATQTYTVGDHFARLAAWYDNEWGFSLRMLDVATLMQK